VVDPADTDAVGAAVGTALDDPAALAARRANARRLVDERLTWDRTIAPLAAWCAHATRRVRRPDALTIEALVPARADETAALATAQGTSASWQRLAEEREAYALTVEAAWQERGAALAASANALATYQRAPWRAALRHTLGGLRGRRDST